MDYQTAALLLITQLEFQSLPSSATSLHHLKLNETMSNDNLASKKKNLCIHTNDLPSHDIILPCLPSGLGATVVEFIYAGVVYIIPVSSTTL